MPAVIAPAVPDFLWHFVAEVCHLEAAALAPHAGTALPQPAQRLLFHERDMTSTLVDFHGEALRVEILQCRERESRYLREVFLRTVTTDRIVEYGVLTVVLENFTPPQQAAIRAGRIPLGALLHQFEIPFASAPIGFFAVPTARFAAPHRAALGGPDCYGRFNRLAKPTGETLAWIMEILPSRP